MSKEKKKSSAVTIDENGVERVTGIEKKYNDRTHVYGRIWGVVALIVFLMIPLSLSLHLNAWPTAAAFAAAASLYIITGIGGIGEDLMYTTLIGPSATYVSFLTGNIANLKFPCTVAAVESADVDIHSDEGEVLATLAVCVSSIVTCLTIAIFCVALTPVIPMLTNENGLFYPAFQQVLPALFGAILVPYCVKNPKLWELPMLAMAILYWFVPEITLAYGMFLSIAISMAGALIMYKAGLLEEKPKNRKKVAVDETAVKESIAEDHKD